MHHVVGEVVHKWQRECSSFAGAGLCDAHDVTSVEHVRDGLFLNGSGALVTERNEGVEHVGVQAHVRKCHVKIEWPRIKRCGLRTDLSSLRSASCNVKGGVPISVKHARRRNGVAWCKDTNQDLTVKTRLRLNPKYTLPSRHVPNGSARKERSNIPRALVMCS